MEIYISYIHKENLEIQKLITFVKNEYFDILDKKECISLKMLAINGRDLIELGAGRGAEVGEGLNMLLNKVLEDSSLNTKEKLIDIYKNR